MWIAPAARGLGVGRRLLGELERTAGEAGVVVLRLETNRALSEAIALYKGSGYVEVKAFNAEPYAHHWLEKTLCWNVIGRACPHTGERGHHHAMTEGDCTELQGFKKG